MSGEPADNRDEAFLSRTAMTDLSHLGRLRDGAGTDAGLRGGAGVSRRFVALVAPEAVGLGVSGCISISLREQNTAALAVFERHIEACDEVMECYLMTGDADYLLRVVVPDIRALERLVLDRLSPIPGVEKIRSSFTLKQVRYKTELPLP